MVKRKQPHPSRATQHPHDPHIYTRTHTIFQRQVGHLGSKRRKMDTEMAHAPIQSGGSTQGHGRAAAEGAKQVGMGLQVTRPPKSIPKLYNNNYTVTLTYADNYRYDVDQAGTTSYGQTWRMNSLFDPDLTGTGHQPLCRDLWASQYDYYAVLACRYTIRLYNANDDGITYTATGTSQQRPGAVNVTTIATTSTTDIAASSGGDIYPIAEMKNTRTWMLPPDTSLEIKGELTPGDFLVDAKDADSDATWTAVGSNPTVGRYLGLVITGCQWTGLVGISHATFSAIQAQVILEYDVQFTQVSTTNRGLPS